jgi:hypothetical protein
MTARAGPLPSGGARRQRQFQAHRLAGEFGQHAFDAAGVLGADPVELEPVLDPHRHHVGIAMQA